MSDSLRTYSGGCHCGAVRFRLMTSARVAYECNCSVCAKKGLLHLMVPKREFELVDGADHLSVYTFNTRVAKHTFCSICGVQAFYTPRSHPDGIDVNIRCLDQGQDDFELRPFDGANWEKNHAGIAGYQGGDA